MTFTIFHFARGSEELTSDCPDVFEGLTLSLMWRGKHSRPDAWRKRWKRAAWIKRLFSRTFDHSRSGDFVDWWTSLVADFRVSHSQALDSEKEPKTLAICGHQLSEDSESVYLESLFSKTSTGSSTPNPRAITAFSTMSLATWKSWVTDQQRLGLVREKSGRLTGDDGGSFLELWPTPRAMSGGPESAKRKKELGRTKSGGGCLQSAVRDWPTPRASASSESSSTARKRMQKRQKEKKPTGGIRTLQTAIFEDTQTDLDLNTKTSRRVYLNPAWVEDLMGFPIGWTDLEHWETQ